MFQQEEQQHDYKTAAGAIRRVGVDVAVGADSLSRILWFGLFALAHDLPLTMAHCQQQQRKQETTTATTTRDNTTTFASDSRWAHVEAKMRPVLPVPEKKNSSPAALWLIPSNWSRSTAGCLWLPLAINTYSFGYGYRRVWGITTRTSRNINININIRVRIRIEIEIEWNNYCGFKFAELDILWHYSRAERSVSNCIVCRVIELVVHKIESLDWPPPERKFMNYAHPLPHAWIYCRLIELSLESITSHFEGITRTSKLIEGPQRPFSQQSFVGYCCCLFLGWTASWDERAAKRERE